MWVQRERAIAAGLDACTGRPHWTITVCSHHHHHRRHITMDYGPSLDHHRMQPSVLGVMPPAATHKRLAAHKRPAAHQRPAACDDAADAGAASCAEVDSPDEVGLPAARWQKTGKGKGRKGGITDIVHDKLSTFVQFSFASSG
jgi:hypothetical protein